MPSREPDWLVALRRSVRAMSTPQRVALLAPLQTSWPRERCLVLFESLRGELDEAQWQELARALHALQPRRPRREADEHASLAA
ncbi:MAG: hypothetical protein EPO12_06515 [Aquabacterium sp.]|jgi:hypothetical protein|nr:MAG: hypothetical protein EPO12_06515 [Aquabacterium sp.]